MNEKEDTVTHANVNNGKSPCARSRAIDIWKYLLHGSIYVLVLLSLGAVSTVLGQTAPSNPAQQKRAVSPVVRQIVVSLHLQDIFLSGARSSVWDCRLIRRPAKDARRRPEPSSAGLQAKAFGHQKMALEPTPPPHNDGVARRVSERIESCFRAHSEFL